MRNNKLHAFTIVELIVVITILAILGTIGFISYVSHISSTRDSSRLSQISIINQAIEGNSKGKAPMPDDKVTVYANGVVIGYQGYVGENVLSEIGVNEGGRDPQDDSYYTIFVDSKQKYAQLLVFLENEEEGGVSYNSIINQAKAADYSEKIPMPYGAKLGVLVETGTNSPIQDVSAVKSSGLDVVTTITPYTAYITKDKTISGTGQVLQKLQQVIWHKGVGFGAPSECPEGFIRVPGNPDFNQPGFCVMKYEATYEDATIPDSCDLGGCPLPDNMSGQTDWNTVKYISGKIPVSKSELYPIADISQSGAIDSCKTMGYGYHLITNDEWMTIARNIEQQNVNWSGGTVGTSGIYRGITMESNTTISLGCSTVNSNGSGSRWYGSRQISMDTQKWGPQKGNDCDSKRQLKLSNGEIIWDLAGNVKEHVNLANTINSIGTDFETTQGNVCGGDLRYSFAGTDGATGGSCSFVPPYSYANYGPKLTNLNANNGIGRIASISASGNRISLRGGNAVSSANSGIFTLNMKGGTSYASRDTGFRCAK